MEQILTESLLQMAEGDAEQVKRLIETSGRESCFYEDEDGFTAIHKASLHGRVQAMKELLLVCKDAAKNHTAGSGDTAAHLAVKSGNFEAVEWLVKEFRDDSEFLNAKNNNGNTILHLAVGMKQLKTVKLLLKNPGVDKNAQNCWNITPLDVLNKTLEYGNDPNPESSHDIKLLLQQVGAVSGSSVKQLKEQASKAIVDQGNHEDYYSILIAVFNLLGFQLLDSEAQTYFSFFNVMTLFISLNILILRIWSGRRRRKTVGFLLWVLMGISVFFAALTCIADLFLKFPRNYHLLLFILLVIWMTFFAVIYIQHLFSGFYSIKHLRTTIAGTLVIAVMAAAVIYFCMRWSSTVFSSAPQKTENTKANHSGVRPEYSPSVSDSMFSTCQQSQCSSVMHESAVSSYLVECLQNKGWNSDSVMTELKFIQNCFAAASAKHLIWSYDIKQEIQEPQSFRSDADDYDHFWALVKAIDLIVDKRFGHADHVPPF